MTALLYLVAFILVLGVALWVSIQLVALVLLLIEGPRSRYFLRTRNRLDYARYCFRYRFDDGYPEPSLLARVIDFVNIMLGRKECPNERLPRY